MKTCLLITTYNRGHLLRNSLDRLTNLTLPDEVVIVDDGSSDNTKAIIEEFKTKLPIKYIYNNNPDWSICSHARNIGIKNTDADIIITSEPELLWITDMIPVLLKERKRYPDEIISASIIYHAQEHAKFNPGFITDPVTALKNEIVEDYQIEPRSYHPNGYCKTVNMQATFLAMYERKWLMDVGGWDEGFPGCWGVDDWDLCTRLRINKINQHICKKLKAIHQWHGHPPPHIMGKALQENEAYMKTKQLDNKEPGDPALIANKDREWGIVK